MINSFIIIQGAIFSITSLLACVAPTMRFHLYGIIPIPAWLAVSGLFAYDFYSTLSNQVFYLYLICLSIANQGLT